VCACACACACGSVESAKWSRCVLAWVAYVSDIRVVVIDWIVLAKSHPETHPPGRKEEFIHSFLHSFFQWSR